MFSAFSSFKKSQLAYLEKKNRVEQEYLDVIRKNNYPISPKQLDEYLSDEIAPSEDNEITEESFNINENEYDECNVSFDLAFSVIDAEIMGQLGKKIDYNGAGSFIIQNNQNSLKPNLGKANIIVNNVDQSGRPIEAEAWLTSSCIHKVSNTMSNYAPLGYNPQYMLKSNEKLYTRGHLIAAMFGGIDGCWNAKTSNPQNIVTQTNWANKSSSPQNKGQCYYENFIRNVLIQGGVVRYVVRPLYSGQNLIPSGNQLMASWAFPNELDSKESSGSFNVFIPNVQKGWTINYVNGQASKVKKKKAS